MLKGLGDMAQIMKLQKEFKDAQKRILKTRMEAESKNGKIHAVVDGEYRLVDIKIDKEFLAGTDPKNLEAMILSAVNNAVDKMKDFSTEELGKLTGGLNLPGLGNLMK